MMTEIETYTPEKAARSLDAADDRQSRPVPQFLLGLFPGRGKRRRCEQV